MSRHQRAAGAHTQPRRLESRAEILSWASERHRALSASLAEQEGRAGPRAHHEQLELKRVA